HWRYGWRRPPASRFALSPAPTASKCSPMAAASRPRLQSRSPIVSSPDKLVYMANQIGKFFRTQGADKAVSGTAEHIKKIWDPRMLRAIFAHLDAGGAGLDPNVREAISQLR